jgi:hypothetical protein
MLWRRRVSARPVTAGVIELRVHDLDDRARIEDRIRDMRFDSWDTVISFVESHSISVGEIARDLCTADPEFGETALSAFVWGVALALRAQADEPRTAASCIAGGLRDFSLPGSLAYSAGLAEGYGKLASMFIGRWGSVMVIVGSRVSSESVDAFARLANQAGQLRGQRWDVLVLCEGEESREHLCGMGEYLRAEVEFSCERGWLRVSRSTATRRPSNSPPVVYAASTLEEGVAILDFESANLCLSLSGPEAVTFAHPVVGVYYRRASGGNRLVRTVAMESLDAGANQNDLISRISGYMADMYAHLRVRGIGMAASKMEENGFVRVGSVGCVHAIMALAHRVAGSFSRNRAITNAD